MVLQIASRSCTEESLFPAGLQCSGCHILSSQPVMRQVAIPSRRWNWVFPVCLALVVGSGLQDLLGNCVSECGSTVLICSLVWGLQLGGPLLAGEVSLLTSNYGRCEGTRRGGANNSQTLGDLVNNTRQGNRYVMDSLEGREIEPIGSLQCQVGDSVYPVWKLYYHLDSYSPTMPAFPQPEGLSGSGTMTSIVSVKCSYIYLQKTKLEHIKLIETHSESKS